MRVVLEKKLVVAGLGVEALNRNRIAQRGGWLVLVLIELVQLEIGLVEDFGRGVNSKYTN